MKCMGERKVNTMDILVAIGATTSSSLTVGQVISWILQHIVGILAILGIFFEIVPIPLHPLKWLSKKFFNPIRDEMNAMKKEITDELENTKNELKEEIEQVRKQTEDQGRTIQNLIISNELDEISRIRWQIIEFARSLDNGHKHMRDEFLQIKELNKRYHFLIEKHNLSNGILDEEMEKINNYYNENKTRPEVYI